MSIKDTKETNSCASFPSLAVKIRQWQNNFLLHTEMPDPHTVKLEKLALEVGQDVQLNTLSALTKQFQNLQGMATVDEAGQYSAADAMSMLSRSRELVEAALLETAKPIHPFDWLYLLRRMPLQYFWPVDEPMA